MPIIDLVASPTPEAALRRATSDYLAISRGAHLYSSPEAHAQAEQKAWDRMQQVRAQVEAARAAGVARL